MTEDEYAAEMHKAFNRGYKERQPEIDALKQDIEDLISDGNSNRKAILEYDEENAALKDEVERLRKDAKLVERLTTLVERLLDRYEQMDKRLSVLEEK